MTPPIEARGHTARRLHYQERSDAYTHIIRADGDRFVCQFPQDSSGKTEAVARRFTACWNACEEAGLSTEALESGVVAEMLAALKNVVSAWEGKSERGTPLYDMQRALYAARSVLARVEGRP